MPPENENYVYTPVGIQTDRVTNSHSDKPLLTAENIRNKDGYDQVEITGQVHVENSGVEQVVIEGKVNTEVESNVYVEVGSGKCDCGKIIVIYAQTTIVTLKIAKKKILLVMKILMEKKKESWKKKILLVVKGPNVVKIVIWKVGIRSF